jgi:glycosyltransferase involved in cell wall biosynthesis
MRIGHFPYKPGGNPYQQLFANSLENTGIEVLRIPPKKWFPLQYACSHAADLLHMDWPHDWYSGRNFLSRLAKRAMYADGLKSLRKISCVWTAHNLAAHDSPDRRDEQRMLQKLIDVCDGIVVMSNIARDLLLDSYRIHGSTRVEVIPHGHYIDVYPNNADRMRARMELNLDPESKVILSPGRILPYKGSAELVASFARVARPGEILIIAGPTAGNEHIRYLRNIAAAECPPYAEVRIVPRFIGENEWQYYFNACDAVALPFRQILNSGSLLLAMSFGKCVVAPKTGSIPEIACGEGWFGYNAEDAAGLAHGLREALDCRDLPAREKKVFAHTRENYGWDAVAARAGRLYRNIMGGI